MDRIKIKISDFTLVNNYKLWGNYRPSKYPNRHIFSREITNHKANCIRPFRITLMLYYDDVKDDFTIKFNGSIRKWYFGKNTRQNLTKKQLNECIKLLSDKIGIREIDLLNAEVTQLEIGVTLLLKSYFKGVINCFVKHRHFTREVDNTTVYLKGKKTKEGKESAFKYKFYDKYLEINKNDMNFLNDLKKMNVQKKFNCFRFEIVLKKVCAVPFYKKNADTLNKILENWEEINYKLMEHISTIHFVDLISDEKEINIDKLGKRDAEKYLQFIAIKRNGFFEELEKFELNNKSTNRSTKVKSFFKNYEYFLDKKFDYRNVLLQSLKKKIDSLV
jgi:hypothetical protein